VAASESADVVDAGAALPVRATAALEHSADAVAATAVAPLSGALDRLEVADSLTGTGSLLLITPRAVLNIIEAPDQAVVAGAVEIAAQAAVQESADGPEAHGRLLVQGSAAAATARDACSATVVPIIAPRRRPVRPFRVQIDEHRPAAVQNETRPAKVA
jgi:hypothetical protein